MNKRLRILKIIRTVCCVPFIFLLCVSLYNSWFGVDAFIDSRYYGLTAFEFTIIAYGIKLRYVELFCLVGFIFSSIQIRRQKR